MRADCKTAIAWGLSILFFLALKKEIEQLHSYFQALMVEYSEGLSLRKFEFLANWNRKLTFIQLF